MSDFNTLSEKANELMARNDMTYGVINFTDLDSIIKGMTDTIKYINQFKGDTPSDINSFDPYDVFNEKLLNENYRTEQINLCKDVISEAKSLKERQVNAPAIDDINNRESSSFNTAISKYTISPLSTPKNGVVAVASATFYDTLTINSITINQSQNGNLYVKMPQKRTNQGNFIDVAHPLNAKARQNINDTLLNGYKNGIMKQEFNVTSQSEISAQNSVKYSDGQYGNNLARLDVVVNDMVVHNAKIVNGKDNNQPFLSMPTYKDKNGEFHSICTPANSEAFKSMSNEALAEYNTEYKFAKCSDEQISTLKDSGIKFNTHTNNNGENIIKFKSADASKVYSTINSIANTAAHK